MKNHHELCIHPKHILSSSLYSQLHWYHVIHALLLLFLCKSYEEFRHLSLMTVCNKIIFIFSELKNFRDIYYN
ncbi:unnamed protein product [Larinioides sclopetarius]|uniref:Uncharacterized protein n=1 Tax=Larinioides sclopetarius TaxID=280406 RepID=A0AAV2ACB5_9ARAC